MRCWLSWFPLVFLGLAGRPSRQLGPRVGASWSGSRRLSPSLGRERIVDSPSE